MGEPIKPWRRLGGDRVAACRVFDVDRVRFEPPDGSPPRDYYVVEAPDWINVVPLTAAGEVVFIRQFRFGIDQVTLEIPGGMCDGTEPPIEAARRELREETGYDTDDLVDLGWVHPNPAVQTNRCHTFLARNARLAGPPAPDEDEELEVVTYPLTDVPGLIRSGAITHALVVAAFFRMKLTVDS